MACSKELETNIDIIIALWVEKEKVKNISWENKCSLRKYIYDLLVAANPALQDEPTHSPTNKEQSMTLEHEEWMF